MNREYDFTGATQFAAEGSSESSSKKELTPLQQGLVTVAGVGLTVTAVGVGLYWANKGIKATADNVAAAADGIKAAHDRHEEKKRQRKAIEDALNQGNA
jgi:hypothetical protein